MDVSVALEQVASVARQRAPVGADHAPHDVLEVLLLRTRQHVLDRGDERRIADDPELAVDGTTQLRERSHAVFRSHAGDVGLEALHLLAGQLCPELVADRRDIEARVPDVDVPHLREARHRFAVLAHCRRHDRATDRVVEARSRPATARLAASRFTSHSNGPGSVSSKSLMLKTSLRSGAAKMPKLERCASPQSWACNPVRGPSARSAAIRYAPPRKKANGDTSIRPYRIGPSSGRRVCACSSSRSMGSLRLGAGSQAACAERGSSARAAFPRAARSAGVKCGTAFGREGLSPAGSRSSRTCFAGSSEADAESESN